MINKNEIRLCKKCNVKCLSDIKTSLALLKIGQTMTVPTFFGEFTGNVVDISVSTELNVIVITVCLFGFTRVKFRPRDIAEILKRKKMD